MIIKELKLKYFCKVKDGTHDTPQYVDEADNTFPLVTSKDITNGILSFNNSKHISYEDYLAINKRSNVEKYDVIMPMIGTVGNPAIIMTDEPFSIKNVALFKTSPNISKAKYLKYMLDSSYIKEQFNLNSRGGVQSFVSLTVLENLKILMPENLDYVISYLDEKTSKVDALINSKLKLINLLEQQRQSNITEAVTKGLNPNVKMKDSGVEWIGEIPEYWELKRLKNAVFLNPSKNEVSNVKNIEVTFLPMENILAPNEVDISIKKKIEEVYNGYTYFKENDLVLAKVTPCFENGNIAVMQNIENGIGFGTTELHVLRPKEQQSISFYYYLAQSAPFKQQGVSTMYGVGGLKRIPNEFVLNYKFGMPPLTEQNEIVEFLNKECREIQNIKQLINMQIQKLKEYRQALIYEAVTGKIDVRDLELE